MNIHTEDTKYCVFCRLLYIIWENGSRDREVFLKISQKKKGGGKLPHSFFMKIILY